MNDQKLRDLIAGAESLPVEFKSDRGPLPDADLIETVVCLGNGQGGMLLLGVEDDGRITGLHPRHQTHPVGLAALIAGRTVPPLAAEVEFARLPEGAVGVVAVPAARQPTSCPSR